MIYGVLCVLRQILFVNYKSLFESYFGRPLFVLLYVLNSFISKVLVLVCRETSEQRRGTKSIEDDITKRKKANFKYITLLKTIKIF